MTYLELQTFVLNDLLDAGDEEAMAARVATAVNLGHAQLQRDGCWQAMEAALYGDYDPAATDPFGLPLDNTVKQVRRVWLAANGESSLPGDLTLIAPATDEEIAAFAQTATQQTPLLRISETSHWPRWWIQQRAVRLLHPAAVSLRLETYSYLPDYAADDDEDWFSVVLPELVGLAAAWRGCDVLWEDSRADRFKQKYYDMLATELKRDQDNKQGGQVEVRRPPLPGSGRY